MFKLLVISAIIVYVSANGYPIPAALKSKWNLDIRDVHLPQDPIEAQVIEVPALELPVKIIYNSKSSGVYVEQVHQPGEKGQIAASHSEEEPHKVIHEVVRPVIQELRETIIPYRRVVQEIKPVIEQVETRVARGHGRENNAGEGGSTVLYGQPKKQSSYANDVYGQYGELWRESKAAAAAARAASKA